MKYLVLGKKITSRPMEFASALTVARDASRGTGLHDEGLCSVVENTGRHFTVAAFERGRDVTDEVLAEFPNELDEEDDGGALQPEQEPEERVFYAN